MSTEQDWMTPDEWEREQDRRYAAARRLENKMKWGPAVGALHDLGCAGGHRNNRKSCHPIPVYSLKELVA